MHVFLCVLFCIFSICNDSKKFFGRLLIFKNFPDFFISMLCTCQKRKNNFHVSNSFKLGEVHWFVIQCVFHCCRTFLFVKLLLKFSTNYFYSFVHCINKKKCRWTFYFFQSNRPLFITCSRLLEHAQTVPVHAMQCCILSETISWYPYENSYRRETIRMWCLFEKIYAKIYIEYT